MGMSEQNNLSQSPSISIPDYPLGSPLGKTRTKALLLGSGELGKEIAISLMRLGVWVCAADSYANAPAQQVAGYGQRRRTVRAA